ncbi:MAG TPA: ATP-dependent zinc metalloprotease FtsH [Kofleriaceae bacterium]|nr:ATP-dependent zinc metalloprotease FtsH [Kofleriaceae bacterium]
MSSEPPPESASGPGPRPRRWGRFIFFLLLLAGFWLWRPGATPERGPEVDYSTAVEWIREGKVESVVIRGAEHGSELEGELRIPAMRGARPIYEFHARAPDDERLVALLDEQGVAIRAEAPESSVVLPIVLSILPFALMILVWVWLSRRTRQMMVAGGPLGGFLRRGKKHDRATAPRATFDDVAGLAAAKRDLGEIVQFLREPGRFHRLGAKVPRGVLLLGPPGTGKTLLARAVAGEADVPFYSITASEFVEMFVGVGAARVRELFQEAKRNAPSIVFIDEIDAVGRARGTGVGGGHDEREQTLNQLLAEMDGFDRGDLTVVIAATNRPDVLDAALLRPGRFDRRVVVELPEAAARRAILAVHTKGKPLAGDVSFEEVAAMTAGFSGAELANLANEAALGATRRRAEQLAREDFLAAFDKIVLGDPRESRLRPAEKTRVAVHEAGHAVLAWITPEAEPLRRVSILPRGMALGATQQEAPEDRHLHTRAELLARLRVLLGGYAAEQAALGQVSTGAEHDLREATRLASNMVAHYGMSDEVGPAYYAIDVEHPFLGARIAGERSTSDATTHAIEVAARALLARALGEAAAAIAAQRERLDRLSAALLASETLEAAALEDVLGPRPGGPPDAVPVEAPVPPTRVARA